MKLWIEAIVGEWRKWFAWYPVRTVCLEWVWLETVEQKIENSKCPTTHLSDWIIYRRIKK